MYTHMPSLGAGPTSPCAASSKGLGQLSQLPQVTKVEGTEGIPHALTPTPRLRHTRTGGLALPCSHTQDQSTQAPLPPANRTSSTVLLRQGIGQTLLSAVVGRSSYPILMTLEPSFPIAEGSKGQEKEDITITHTHTQPYGR